VEDVIPAASVLTNGLVIFYGALLVAMSLLALVLTWQPASRLNFWRGITSGWPYPVVLLAAFAAIWFKNIDVVRADTYLKEGERYRGQQQWTQAIALHGRARSLDSDEDFYYLMLALDYQLMAQDYSLQQGERQAAWNEGEHIALQARTINPYNPDNTGNMGRYYFTLGQVSDPARFQDALEFFQKATVLAPSNVIYYNLWAQTHYMLGEYPSATTQLEISTQIDPKYPPTWSLLGDTYAAMGDAAKALPAHIQAVKVGGLGTFTDQVFTQRANFYISTGNVVTLTKALAEAVPNSDKSAPLQALIGQLYNMAGQHEQAITYLERARTLGDTSAKTAKLLGNSYLSLEKLAEARPLYEAVVTQNPKDLEAQRALGYICANTGCLDVAERAFWAVLTAEPNDYNSRKNLALVYEQMGQPEKALEQARLALSNAPESEKATLNQFIATLESITTKPPDGL
jgi:tetratricopeptide (TPR) repeat protein